MSKVAKIVAVSFITRVVVDEDDSLETIASIAEKSIIAKIGNNEFIENIEDVFEDKECPFGSLEKDV
jgi:hypothetical protein